LDIKKEPSLLDLVRGKLRRLHRSIRTEKAYVAWIAEFFRFHQSKCGLWVHPKELGAADLAVNRQVAASTQSQAFAALLFLFRDVLDMPIRVDAQRAKRPKRLPVVLSIDEVRRLLEAVSPGPKSIMARLMYGAGLRVMEVCRLRVKDIDFDRRQTIVRDGKGGKDRAVPVLAGIPSGCGAFGHRIRWCRFAQPPANGLDTSGILTETPGAASLASQCSAAFRWSAAPNPSVCTDGYDGETPQAACFVKQWPALGTARAGVFAESLTSR
jgi:hypothetical protein